MNNQTQQPSSELDFFPYLNQQSSQLTDLKKFWEAVNELLYTRDDQKNNKKKAAKTNQAEGVVPERVKNLVQPGTGSENDQRQLLANELWNWIMMDDPDRMLLKYIRAKKFKSTNDSLELLINSLKFRAERKLSQIYYEDQSILKQLRTAKAFVFGFDRSGSPIFRVNACKHKTNDQTPRELEDFILYSMELTRLFIIPPAETVTMLVDLSGFGMSNMDWKCTSFMISTLESYYPETLNHQIIHNAPWIFQGLWKAISTMIDPVVRSKVLFTSKNEDLIKLVDKQNLFKAEGGESGFEWKIPENYPADGPASAAAKTDQNGQETRGRLHLDLSPEQERTKLSELHTRETLVARFIALTQLWLKTSDENQNPSSDPQKLLKILALRELVKLILRAQYLKMMPLIIPKTIYHYRGILKTEAPGLIDFEASEADGNVNGGSADPEQQQQNGSPETPTMMGQESARPDLLKTIERDIARFRSTYLASSSDAALATPDAAAPTENLDSVDPIERIFIEVTRLDF